MSDEPAPRPAARRGRPHPARRARRTAGWLAASAACVLALGMGISTRIGDHAETTTSSSGTVAGDQTAVTSSGSSSDDSTESSSLTDAGSATGSSSTGSSSAQTASSGSAA